MKAGESMRQNFAQILKDAKIDIKVEYQKLYGMLYDRSIPVSNTNRISVYDELSTYFIAFCFRGTCLSLDEFNDLHGYIGTGGGKNVGGHRNYTAKHLFFYQILSDLFCNSRFGQKTCRNNNRCFSLGGK